ncbi:MAG: hypothetical protein FD180_3771 [Planctomycetota bacterium]|nr:MAG: hypothetical protein FD180_3771 [Planctomycetota bacterium]
MHSHRILPFMPTPDGQPRTLDDYMRLDVEHGIELIEGEFVVSPAPDPRHQTAILRMGSILDEQVRRLRLGRIYIAPLDVVLSRITAVQPDVLFLSNSSLARLDRRLEGPPDIAIEFLSRGNPENDLDRKLKLYRKYGVPEYWIGDPEARTLAIRRLSGGSWSEPVLLDAGGVATSPMMPGVRVPLAEVFID